MKTHNLTQGSPEWLVYRSAHFNASDAPAMLGLSPYKTRTELLHELHTGLSPEIDAATQRRFDAGHAAEAAARPLAESEIGEDLYPVVGSLEVNGLPLSASFDGLTMAENIAWEHKLMNVNLAESLADGIIPDSYHPQLEQQLIVSGAEKALFMATSADQTAMECVWYTSRPELRASILQGWGQFAADLKAYVPTETIAAPVGRTPETLPALHIEVTGMVTASNLAEFKKIALGAIRSVNRELKTDQDFADSSKARKWCSDIESKAKAAKQHALGQTATIDELFRALDEISNEARDTRIELERIEKARNATMKTEIVASGQTAMSAHIAVCNERIGRPLMPVIPADFATVIKGMSKFDNMRNAVSTELARAKIAANEWADRIILSLRMINEQEGFGHLFYDQAQLVLRDTDYVAMVIKSRIAGHLAAEADRIEADRQRIAAEERAKAQAAERARADAEIAAATAKARAEAHAQEQADAAAKRASDEAINNAAYMAKIDSSRMKNNASGQPATDPVAELNAAKSLPGGSYVSPAAQAIYEAEGAERFERAHTPPTLRLGQICERLGFTLTADFMRQLGFEPAATDKAAKLYHENDFPRICAVLVRHIQTVSQGVAA